MHIKQNYIGFIVAVLSAAVAGQDFINRDSELNLLAFMARSKYLMQRNPSRSVDCFSYYGPLINECVVTYEKNVEVCSNTANTNRSEIEDASLLTRMDFRNRTEQSFDSLNLCGDQKLAKDEYECYNSEGLSSAKINQAISSDALIELNKIKEETRIIDYNEDTCKNDCKIVYEKENAAAYDGLSACLMGAPLPTTTEHYTTDDTTTEMSS